MSHHSDVYWTCLAYFQGILPDPVAPTSPADVGGQSGAPGDPPAGVRSPPSPPRVYGDPMTPPRPPQSFINPRRRPPRATAGLRPGLPTLPEASAVPQSVTTPPSPSKPWVCGDPQTPPRPPQSFINPRRRVPPAATAASERDGPLTRLGAPAVPCSGGPDDGGEHAQTGPRTGDEADSTGKRARTPPLDGITTSESTVTSMPPANSRRVRFTLPDPVDDPPPPTAPRREIPEPTVAAAAVVATAKPQKSMPQQEFEAFYFSELPPLQTPTIVAAPPLALREPGSVDTVTRVATTTPRTVPTHDPSTVTATAVATATVTTTADLSAGMPNAGAVRSLFPPIDVADDPVSPAPKVAAAANVDALPTHPPASTPLLTDIATVVSTEATALEAVVEVDTPNAPHPLAQRPPKIVLTTVPPPTVLVSPLPALPIGEAGSVASILADALSQQLPWRPEIPPALIVGECARLRLPSHDVVDAALAMRKFRCLGQLVHIDRNTRIFDPPAP